MTTPDRRQEEVLRGLRALLDVVVEGEKQPKDALIKRVRESGALTYSDWITLEGTLKPEFKQLDLDVITDVVNASRDVALVGGAIPDNLVDRIMNAPVSTPQPQPAADGRHTFNEEKVHRSCVLPLRAIMGVAEGKYDIYDTALFKLREETKPKRIKGFTGVENERGDRQKNILTLLRTALDSVTRHEDVKTNIAEQVATGEFSLQKLKGVGKMDGTQKDQLGAITPIAVSAYALASKDDPSESRDRFTLERQIQSLNDPRNHRGLSKDAIQALQALVVVAMSTEPISPEKALAQASVSARKPL